MMTKRQRSTWAFRDVVTDDDLARLIHAMNARSSEVFHRQVCEDPGCTSFGPAWSEKILAEVWNEMPRYPIEIAPAVGLPEEASESDLLMPPGLRSRDRL